MKTTVQILITFILLIPVYCFSQAGTPDSNFNRTGIVHYPQGVANTVAIQKDGKIVVGGSSPKGFILVRYGAGGTIDKSFGTNGIVYAHKTTYGIVNSIAIQPDGKIVAVGVDTTDFDVKRFQPNGTLDSSFGKNGQVSTVFGNWVTTANHIIIQPNNKILVVGTDYNDDPFTRIALVRYNSDGTLDNSFGKNGKKAIGYEDFNTGTSVILQADGKIIVTGSSNYNFAVMRLKLNGAIDSTFGINGIAVTHFNGSNAEITAAAIQSDGKIVVTGSTYPFKTIALARYTKNGKADSSFGTNGILYNEFFGVGATATGLAIQHDDKIVISSAVTHQDGNGFGVARFTKNGKWDNSFGNGGEVITQIFDEPQYADEANAVTLQRNGKIVAAGTSGGYFAVVRYKNDAAMLNVSTDNSDLKIAYNTSSLIKIFPNPVKDILHVSGIATNTSIAVYNTQGKLVIQATSANQSCDLNIKVLPAGIYYLQITYTDKKARTFKFVKQ